MDTSTVMPNGEQLSNLQTNRAEIISKIGKHYFKQIVSLRGGGGGEDPVTSSLSNPICYL